MVAITQPSAYYTISADSLHKASNKPSHLEKRMANKKVSEERQTAEQRREAILIAKQAQLAKKTQHVREVCEEQKSINHQAELRRLDALLNKTEIVYENRRTQQEQKQNVISQHNAKVQLIASTQAVKRAELSQQQQSEDSLKTYLEEVKSAKGDDTDAKVWEVSVDELKVSSKKPASSFSKSVFVGGETAVEARKNKLSRRSVQVSYQIQNRNQVVEAKRLEIAAKHFAKLNQSKETAKATPTKDVKAIIAKNESDFIAAASAALNKKLYLADVRRAAVNERKAHPVVEKEQRLKSYSFEIEANHVASSKPKHLAKRFESRSKDLSADMLAAAERRQNQINMIKNKAAKENKKSAIVSSKSISSKSLKNLELANRINMKSEIASSNKETMVNGVAFKSGMHVASAKRTGGFSKTNKRIARSAAQQKKFVELVAKAIETSGDFDKLSFTVDVDSLKVKAGKPMHLEKRIAARSA